MSWPFFPMEAFLFKLIIMLPKKIPIFKNNDTVLNKKEEGKTKALPNRKTKKQPEKNVLTL